MRASLVSPCLCKSKTLFFSDYKNSFSDLGPLAKVKAKLLTWLRITIIKGDGKTAAACDLNKQNIYKDRIFFLLHNNILYLRHLP